MIDEPLSRGQSLLHRLAPRWKLVAAACLTVGMAPLQTTHAAWAALGLGVLLLLVARLPLRLVRVRLGAANGLFLLLILSLSLTYPGERWATWQAIRVDGLLLGLQIAIKGNAMLCVMLALVCTSSVAALAQGLRALGAPQKLVLLLAFSYRQLFVTAAEFERRRLACRARCFTPRMSMHTYRTMAHLLGQSLLGSLDRAQRIQDAMAMRGFTGTFHTLDSHVRTQRGEGALVAIALVAGASLVALDMGWLS